MEVFDAQEDNELLILKVESSNGIITFFENIVNNEKLALQLSPTLLINLPKKIFAVKIKALFYKNSSMDTAISTPVLVSVLFSVKSFDSVFNITDGNLEITQMPVILKMLDITIGTIRGVLLEQTKGTTLSNFSLPVIPIKDLAEQLEVRVSMKKEA